MNIKLSKRNWVKFLSVFLSICIITSLGVSTYVGAESGSDIETAVSAINTSFIAPYFELREMRLTENYTVGTASSAASTTNELVSQLAANIDNSIIETVNARAEGFKNYLNEYSLSVADIRSDNSELYDASMSDGMLIGYVYEWTEFDWHEPETGELITSLFGTLHKLTFSIQGEAISLVKDEYDEEPITGINTVETVSELELNSEVSVVSANALSCTGTVAGYFSTNALSYYADLYVGPYDWADGVRNDYEYYNRQYLNYKVGGGDCANFASQCLHYAGLDMTSSWWYSDGDTPCENAAHSANSGTSYVDHSCTSDDTSSSAWRGCSAQATTLSSYYSSSSSTSFSAADFEIGDLLYTSSYAHVYICSSIVGTTPLFSSHTNDYKNIPLPSTGVLMLHIHRYDTTCAGYTATQHVKMCTCDDGGILTKITPGTATMYARYVDMRSNLYYMNKNGGEVYA